MIIYANSDSYGVYGTTELRYPEFLGELFKAQVINNGKGGACNQRIFRTTVRDLTEIKKTSPTEKILAVICLGSMIRNEWWDPTYTPEPQEVDGHFRSFQIHGVPENRHSAYYNYATEWYRLYDDEAEQTNLLMYLTMLTGWFESQNIDYLIFAGNNISYKQIDYSGPFIKTFAEEIFNNKKILNLNDFSFTKYSLEKNHHPYDFDQWGIHGHHGEDAHRDFAKFLFEYYNKL